MAYGDLYKIGTLTVAAGGTAVTGTGTAWATGASALRKGDHILAAGHRAVIEAVTSDTALTLAIPWTGGALTNAAYVAEMDAATRNASASVAASLQALLDKISRVDNAGGRYICVSVGGNAPPSSPVAGDLYVVGPSPTGAWAGYADYFARWLGAAWQFWTPVAGEEAKDLATGNIWFFTSAGAWNANSLTAGTLRYDLAQSLTSAQRTQARENAGLFVTAWALGLLDDASASAALTTLGVSDFAKTILDDANAAAVRVTLGVGDLATQAASAVTITGGSMSGVTISGGSIGAGVTIDGGVFT